MQTLLDELTGDFRLTANHSREHGVASQSQQRIYSREPMGEEKSWEESKCVGRVGCWVREVTTRAGKLQHSITIAALK